MDTQKIVEKPKKRDYRQRAHCNPLSDGFINYPISPRHVDWSLHYPYYFEAPTLSESLCFNTTEHPIEYTRDEVPRNLSEPLVRILDVGCGYGGLSVHLATLYSDKIVLALEIREKVTEFLGRKILSLRSEHAGTDATKYQNIAVLRTNAMKFLVNYFGKHQIEKMFFCFPDPHFKRSNWRRRIINRSLLSVYAYILKPCGRIYTVTDVEDLHLYMKHCLLKHPLFEELEVNENDECVKAMLTTTEEGMKARRNGSKLFYTVFTRAPWTENND